ncbi:MAG: hypothetical protein ACYSW8_29875 [Planctomycetota bacterium]|jgi:hypothetical protein
MPKGKEKKGTGAKPGNEPEGDIRHVRFVPKKVTKGAVRFVEATATGKAKVQSKSVWRTMYGRLFDSEGGLDEYLDDDGKLGIKALNVTIEIER